MTESDQTLLIAAGGLVLSGLTYFAGVQRGRRDLTKQQAHATHLQVQQQQHERQLEAERQLESRITGAVERYVKMYETGYASGIYALALSGLELLGTDAAIRDAIDRIQKIIRNDPWGALRIRVGEVDLLAFFSYVNAHNVNFANQSVEAVLDAMRADGSYRHRPT